MSYEVFKIYNLVAAIIFLISNNSYGCHLLRFWKYYKNKINFSFQECKSITNLIASAELVTYNNDKH